jgi:peptidoglycan/LPS O-acetylase OafA/YrhL
MINRYFPTYPFNVFMRGDAIAIGCLLALNYDNVKWICKSYKSIGLMLVLFGLSYLILQPGSDLPFMQILVGSSGWSLIDNLAIAILLIISIEYKNSLWYGLLNSKPMVFLGMISYSMYLWQQIFTSPLDLGKINQLPFNLIFIFIASVLSYSLIEKPFLRLKERFS